jgi:hypothetical protein
MPCRPIALAALALGAVILAAAPAGADVTRRTVDCADGPAACTWNRPSVTTPRGWIEDEATGRSEGIVLLLPSGRTLEDAPVWIYARAIDNPDGRDLGAVVATDQAERREEGDQVTITPRPDGRLSDGRPVQIYDLADTTEGRQSFERIAAFADTDAEGRTYTVVLTLAAEERAEIDRTEAVIAELIASYR